MSVPLIAVIYDGMHNSVFASQVLQPLINAQQKEPHKSVWLVSFEAEPKKCLAMQEQIRAQGVHCVVLKKMRFLGQWTLRIAAYHLKKLLSGFPQYELLARGPLAGFICAQAIDAHTCAQLTIQARGLLAEEYAYTHRHVTNTFKRYLHAWRTKQFFMLERCVYGDCVRGNASRVPITIQAVSPALGDYLIATYATPQVAIAVAWQDIPPSITTEQRNTWRAAMRAKMTIAEHVRVYCYNGSVKPWQFPEGVLQFFKERYQEDDASILVILTPDVQQFEALLAIYHVPAHAYRIYSVLHTQIYAYLSACDVGILFREQTVVNWTSRPTKLLEYQAVGLEVVHNNTVAYAMEKS